LAARLRTSHAHDVKDLCEWLRRLAEMTSARVKIYGVANHYLSLSVAVVSLGLAAAADAAASLIAQLPSLGPNRITLWHLWSGGVLAIVVGYGGPMVGAFALPPSIPLIQDLVAPLILGISEFLIFAVFIRKFTPTTDISITLVTWFAANAIYGLTAFAVVLRARFLYKQSRGRYRYDVLPALDSYIAYMTLSLFGPAMLVTFAVVGAVCWWAWHGFRDQGLFSERSAPGLFGCGVLWER
jgi:hypothetical protein